MHLMSQAPSPLKSTAIIAALLSIALTPHAQAQPADFMHSTVKQATTLDTLPAIQDWQHPANGVWSASIGDMANELRYTDLAAEPPRIGRLNTLGDPDFPSKPIRFATPSTPMVASWCASPAAQMKNSTATVYSSIRLIRPAACWS